MPAYLPWLDERSVERSSSGELSYHFPPVETALEEPDGLLCAGGDLSMGRLLSAYGKGIFPWFSSDQPILWWSPDPRCLFLPGDLHVSRSLRRRIKRQMSSPNYRFTFDTDFSATMAACADREETWITPDMTRAYHRLHKAGHAHSAELWHLTDNGRWQLVGGLYGLALGRCFFGESMFSRQTDASKIVIALLFRHLTHWGYRLLDCQVVSDHLLSLGATVMPRVKFSALLEMHVAAGSSPQHQWKMIPELLQNVS
ncbi:MAG: leucyl/phenylalanyl-tRNA--protein transferase [unclassified Hahellaceae]|nr:leucyl/phenylalanyl-tRNA--protein transferase [Hahellaceae bacterium]|tara:strand:+ start:69208 stop:69975 length:768 start_codon:yes stop_codon:yes gene_type:complete